MPNKAEIVYVLPVLDPAGAERIVADLAKRIPARGFSVSVVCLEDERASVGAELSAAGVAVHGLRLSRRRTLACANALRARLPKTRPLIVHAHLFHANMAARFAFSGIPKGERAGIHVLNTIHVAERRFRPWQFAMDRATAAHARAEVCVSRAVARFQQEKTGLPEAFFRVIENGISLERFYPPETAVPTQRILSVGRLDPQKNYPLLLQAWKTVSAAFPRATLSIAGSGPEESTLKGICRKSGFQNVQFLGFVQDIPALMRESSIYVQPSAWEGFGLAVAEAMACALPPIVTDVDSLPEVVTHGKTGLVVPKDDAGVLAGALISLLSDPAHASALGAAARAEAIKRFSVERMADDYAALYDELLDG